MENTTAITQVDTILALTGRERVGIGSPEQLVPGYQNSLQDSTTAEHGLQAG